MYVHTRVKKIQKREQGAQKNKTKKILDRALVIKFFAGEFCWVKGDVTYVLQKKKKEKTREAGLTTRVGRNAIYPRRQRLHPFHIRAAETFIRIRQD